MDNAKEITIWDKLQVDQAATKPKSKDGSTTKKKGSNYKIIGQLGKVFGIPFWTYLIIQVFFFDIDAYLKTALPQNTGFIVDYKFFAFLLITALFALFIKRYYLVYLYIIIYPLTVLFWEFPKLIYKFKSWLVFLGVIDAISSFFYKIKYKIIVTTTTLFGFLLVFVFNSKPVIVFGCIVLALVLIFSIARTIYLSFKTPVFLKFQSGVIGKIIKSNFTRHLILIDDKIKQSKAKKLTREQSNTVLTNLQTGLLFHRIIYFWAYQLEKYRASKISFVLGGISYIWLFIKLVVFLAFINYGIYRINPAEFKLTSGSFIHFINYSLNSLFFNETSQLLAIGNFSTAVRIISGVTWYLLLTVLVFNFIYVAKQSKDDRELSGAINEIKNQGKELEMQIKGEYSVTAEEGIKKLQDFKTGLLSLILLISSKLPKNYWSETNQ